MSYYSRLHEQSRRAQDQPDDGLGLLRWGLAMIAVLALLGWVLA